MKPLLILRMGLTAYAVRSTRGNYEHYFQEVLVHLETPIVVKDAVAGELPDPEDYAAILVTGSPASVTDREPWSEAAGQWLRRAMPTVPILGVCYGHQIIAHALGGEVQTHPGGPELGVYEVEVLEDDPLFEGFGPVFPAFEVHWDHVSVQPPGSRLIARTPEAPLHALAYGTQCRTVQFHPEFDADLVRGAVLRHGEMLQPPRPAWVQEQHDAVTELPDQPRIITNFLKHFTEVR